MASPPDSKSDNIAQRYPKFFISVVVIAIAGLILLLVLCDNMTYSEEEQAERAAAKATREAEKIDVRLDASVNPTTLSRQLTPEQTSGEDDVVVSYGPVTHSAWDGPQTRLPGRVVAHTRRSVEVVLSRERRDAYVVIFVAYDDDFDTRKLHTDKDNLASCRFARIAGNHPTFHDCDKNN